jgi:hypothetical protein
LISDAGSIEVFAVTNDPGPIIEVANEGVELIWLSRRKKPRLRGASRGFGFLDGGTLDGEGLPSLG